MIGLTSPLGYLPWGSSLGSRVISVVPLGLVKLNNKDLRFVGKNERASEHDSL